MDPRGFFAVALLATTLVACSDAEPTAQSADAVELGSVKRLFGTLVDKMTDLITREPLAVAEEPGADWQPPLYAFGEEPAKSFDGAIIGTRVRRPHGVRRRLQLRLRKRKDSLRAALALDCRLRENDDGGTANHVIPAKAGIQRGQ